MKLIVSLGLCLPLLLGSTAARAEEAAADGAQSDKQAAVARPLGLTVRPAWQNDDVTGSLYRYEKYITPPHEGFIDELNYEALAGSFPYLRFNVTRPGQPGSTASVRWEDPFPRSFVELAMDRYRFYLNPDASGSSLRQNWLFSAGTPLSDGKTYLSLAARRTNLYIAKTGQPVDWATTSSLLSATRPFAAGDATLSVGLRRFDSHSSNLPDSDQIRYTAAYERDLSGLALLGLSYNLASTHLYGVNPTTGSVALRAVSPVTSNLVATLNLSAANTWSNITQNAYTRASDAARLGLSYRGFRGLLLRGGYDYYQYSRIDNYHLRTEQPEWSNLWVNGSYRPLRRWQVVAKAAYRENPNPQVSSLTDPIPLVMNIDRNAEVRVQGSLTDNASVYLGTGSRFRRNTRRNIDLREDTASVGGWMQVAPRLSLNADYSLLRMDSRNLALQNAMTDSYVTTLGGSLGLPRSMSLDASYSNYRAANAQNIGQNVWGVALHRSFAGGASWNVELRRDEYRDRLAPALSYDANVLSVGGSAHF